MKRHKSTTPDPYAHVKATPVKRKQPHEKAMRVAAQALGRALGLERVSGPEVDVGQYALQQHGSTGVLWSFDWVRQDGTKLSSSLYMRCKPLAKWLNEQFEKVRLEKVQAIAAGAAQKIEAERSQQARREALEGTSTIDLIAEIEYRVSVECEGLTEEETAKLFDLSGRDWSDLYDDMGPFDKQVLVEELASGGHYAANGDDDDVSRLKDACVRRRDSDIVYFVQQIAADQGYPGWRPRS